MSDQNGSLFKEVAILGEKVLGRRLSDSLLEKTKGESPIDLGMLMELVDDIKKIESVAQRFLSISKQLIKRTDHLQASCSSMKLKITDMRESLKFAES